MKQIDGIGLSEKLKAWVEKAAAGGRPDDAADLAAAAEIVRGHAMRQVPAAHVAEVRPGQVPTWTPGGMAYAANADGAEMCDFAQKGMCPLCAIDKPRPWSYGGAPGRKYICHTFFKGVRG